jgi:hypothetical protein
MCLVQKAWPAGSPDLMQLDYFLWGHMKYMAYRQKSYAREEFLNSQVMTAGKL